jgi:hypothetical protein
MTSISDNKLVAQYEPKIKDNKWNDYIKEIKDYADGKSHECCKDKRTIDDLYSFINDYSNKYVNEAQKLYDEITKSKFFTDIQNIIDLSNSYVLKFQYQESEFQKSLNEKNTELNNIQNDNLSLMNLKKILTDNSIVDYNKNLKKYIETNTDYNNNLTNTINNYNNQILSVNKKLYDSIYYQNLLLKNRINNIKDEISKNKQKTSFFLTNRDFLRNSFNIVFAIYFIFVFILILFILFTPSSFSNYNKPLLVIFSILYPFIIVYLENLLYNFWNYALSIFTGKVFYYKSLN